jgi:hypothetical protein
MAIVVSVKVSSIRTADFDKLLYHIPDGFSMRKNWLPGKSRGRENHGCETLDARRREHIIKFILTCQNDYKRMSDFDELKMGVGKNFIRKNSWKIWV